MAKISGKEFRSQEQQLWGEADLGSEDITAGKEGSEFKKNGRKKKRKKEKTMSPSLLIMEKVTYQGDYLGAEVLGSKAGGGWWDTSGPAARGHGCQQSRKNRDYRSQLAVAIAEGLVTHLIQILSDQSFALYSHGTFYLILRDRKHSLLWLTTALL